MKKLILSFWKEKIRLWQWICIVVLALVLFLVIPVGSFFNFSKDAPFSYEKLERLFEEFSVKNGEKLADEYNLRFIGAAFLGKFDHCDSNHYDYIPGIGIELESTDHFDINEARGLMLKCVEEVLLNLKSNKAINKEMNKSTPYTFDANNLTIRISFVSDKKLPDYVVCLSPERFRAEILPLGNLITYSAYDHGSNQLKKMLEEDLEEARNIQDVELIQ